MNCWSPPGHHVLMVGGSSGGIPAKAGTPTAQARNPTYGASRSACRRPRRLPVFSRVPPAAAGPATSCSSEKLAASSIGRSTGISLRIDTAEQRNPPLGPLEQVVGLTQQSDAFLVAPQGLVKADLPLFQQMNDLLQPAERLLEVWGAEGWSCEGSGTLLSGVIAMMRAPCRRYFTRLCREAKASCNLTFRSRRALRP